MCSIMGYSGTLLKKDKFKEGFDKTVSRGPDMSKIIEVGDAILGFHRLAIMGLDESGMQPFYFENKYVVCNGEIYGFRKLKQELLGKGYTFKSDSDCELLLPMYKEYGTDMFEKLDAEFALIIYDEENGGIIAARDPIGIRPLYYGMLSNGDYVFASEAKNLVSICKKVMPFPPGHYFKNGKFKCYNDYITFSPLPFIINLQNYTLFSFICQNVE